MVVAYHTAAGDSADLLVVDTLLVAVVDREEWSWQIVKFDCPMQQCYDRPSLPPHWMDAVDRGNPGSCICLQSDCRLVLLYLVLNLTALGIKCKDPTQQKGH
jgi:hypothetical protein